MATQTGPHLSIDRRRLLTLTAGGAAAAALGGLGGATPAFAAETVRWVSPRGTIEVLDDYPYWVAKKFGYFGDIADDARARAVGRDRDGQARRPEAGGYGLSLARRLLARARAGHPARLGLPHGRHRRVRHRLSGKARSRRSLKDLEGKTILLGSAGWQSICDPMLYAAGVDVKKIKYVEAGWPTWGTALKAGKGDAAL